MELERVILAFVNILRRKSRDEAARDYGKFITDTR